MQVADVVKNLRGEATIVDVSWGLTAGSLSLQA